MGELTEANDLVKRLVERSNTWSIGDALILTEAAARITELEAHCVRLGQGDAERYWEARYRDEAAANAHLHAEIARKDTALKGARETILDLKNARWSEAEGTDAEWVAEIDAALSNATRDASERFAQWINDGPALAKAAGCYVGITVSDYPALSNATTPETGGGE